MLLSQPRRFSDLDGGHSRIRTYDFHRVNLTNINGFIELQGV
jgi:hypothetical protein